MSRWPATIPRSYGDWKVATRMQDVTAFRPGPFWVQWLTVAACGISLFGLGLVLAPTVRYQGIGLLLYADPKRVAPFGGEALRYITLLHGVLGAVVPASLIGWIITPIGTAIALWVAFKKVKGDMLRYYCLVALFWLLIAVLGDYFFIVKAGRLYLLRANPRHPALCRLAASGASCR
jgi:hypothetical protein